MELANQKFACFFRNLFENDTFEKTTGKLNIYIYVRLFQVPTYNIWLSVNDRITSFKYLIKWLVELISRHN